MYIVLVQLDSLIGTMSTLRSVIDSLEAPFRFEWAVDASKDDRPFGDASWLPIMAIVYFMTLTVTKHGAELYAPNQGGKPLIALALVNNIVMCVYSAWCLCAVASIVMVNWSSVGYSLTVPFCDRNRTLLESMDLQLYIFYLSKFWEWMDTYVLVIKGKPVWPPQNSQFLLHIFHHTTTATVGWLAWRQELSVAWIGPLTNAFVHTIMYGYYAAVTVFPDLRKYGIYITPIQILQFMVCLLALVPDTIDALAFESARCGATKRCVAWILFAYFTYLGFFIKMFQDKKKARQASRTAKNK